MKTIPVKQGVGAFQGVLNFVGSIWLGLLGGGIVGGSLFLLAQGFGLLNSVSALVGFVIVAVQLAVVCGFSWRAGRLVGLRGLAMTVAGAVWLCINLGGIQSVVSVDGIEIGQKIYTGLMSMMTTVVPWSLPLVGMLFSVVEIADSLGGKKYGPTEGV